MDEKTKASVKKYHPLGFNIREPKSLIALVIIEYGCAFENNILDNNNKLRNIIVVNGIITYEKKNFVEFFLYEK